MLHIRVFLLHLEAVGEARPRRCGSGLGHRTERKGRSKHTQDKFLSTPRGGGVVREASKGISEVMSA